MREETDGRHRFPLPAYRVATDFPNLNIVIQHAAWPYSREAVGLCYRRPNVYLVPGQYIHYEFPGSEDYVKAANRQLSDQIMYGSVYPKHKYLEGNARRLLGL